MHLISKIVWLLSTLVTFKQLIFVMEIALRNYATSFASISPYLTEEPTSSKNGRDLFTWYK